MRSEICAELIRRRRVRAPRSKMSSSYSVSMERDRRMTSFWMRSASASQLSSSARRTAPSGDPASVMSIWFFIMGRRIRPPRKWWITIHQHWEILKNSTDLRYFSRYWGRVFGGLAAFDYVVRRQLDKHSVRANSRQCLGVKHTLFKCRFVSLERQSLIDCIMLTSSTKPSALTLKRAVTGYETSDFISSAHFLGTFIIGLLIAARANCSVSSRATPTQAVLKGNTIRKRHNLFISSLFQPEITATG